MQALAASCEELHARTGNPPLRKLSLDNSHQGYQNIGYQIFQKSWQQKVVEFIKV
jgi:hypothetical protein